MAYTIYEAGRTGPSGNIGGSSDYHIDSKFSTGLGEGEARRRFEEKVKRYNQLGRNVEFSNQGVGGLVYDMSLDDNKRADLFRQAYGAHAPREGFYSLDYYAPKVGEDRFGKSAEGAPIFAVGSADGRRETGVGGNYGFHSFLYDKDGNLTGKVGHGDDRFTDVGKGTPIDGAQPIKPSGDKTPSENIGEAKERAANYSAMSKSEMNAAYDAMRNDPVKASIEGEKMHKAYFKK